MGCNGETIFFKWEIESYRLHVLDVRLISCGKCRNSRVTLNVPHFTTASAIAWRKLEKQWDRGMAENVRKPVKMIKNSRRNVWQKKTINRLLLHNKPRFHVARRRSDSVLQLYNRYITDFLSYWTPEIAALHKLYFSLVLANSPL